MNIETIGPFFGLGYLRVVRLGEILVNYSRDWNKVIDDVAPKTPADSLIRKLSSTFRTNGAGNAQKIPMSLISFTGNFVTEQALLCWHKLDLPLADPYETFAVAEAFPQLNNLLGLKSLVLLCLSKEYPVGGYVPEVVFYEQEDPKAQVEYDDLSEKWVAKRCWFPVIGEPKI